MMLTVTDKMRPTDIQILLNFEDHDPVFPPSSSPYLDTLSTRHRSEQVTIAIGAKTQIRIKIISLDSILPMEGGSLRGRVDI